MSEDVLIAKENPDKYHRVELTRKGKCACNNHFGYGTEVISMEEAENRGLDPCMNWKCFRNE